MSGVKNVPRKQSEINIVSAFRIKELLHDHNMTQKQLSDKLHYSEQHISLILTGKRPLLVSTAQEIASLFAPVRFEWIMGYDDFRTPTEYKEFPHAKVAVDKQFSKQAVTMLADTLGYKFKIAGSHGVPFSLDEVVGISDEAREMLAKHADAIRGDCKYEVTRDGISMTEISIDEFNSFVLEIKDFTEFKLSKLCKEAHDNG